MYAVIFKGQTKKFINSNIPCNVIVLLTRRCWFGIWLFSIILFLLAAVSFQLKTEAEDKEEQIRRSYFIAKLQEADGLAEDKKIPKALSALTQLQPKNNEELNLFRARLLSMVSQTQFPKKNVICIYEYFGMQQVVNRAFLSGN